MITCKAIKVSYLSWKEIMERKNIKTAGFPFIPLLYDGEGGKTWLLGMVYDQLSSPCDNLPFSHFSISHFGSSHQQILLLQGVNDFQILLPNATVSASKLNFLSPAFHTSQIPSPPPSPRPYPTSTHASTFFLFLF